MENCPLSLEQLIHDAERLWPRDKWEKRRYLGITTYTSGHVVSFEFTKGGNLSVYVWREA